MNSFIPLSSLLGLVLALGMDAATPNIGSFRSYPVGDDVTTSLGQFQLIVDPALADTLNAILTNTPLAQIEGLPGVLIWDGGVFTSPVLFDPSTTIGRSDSFSAGAPEDAIGVIAGKFPGQTYISDGQLTVRPSWAEAANGAQEVHTFIKSLNLSDSLTTKMGFSVKAGMQAPTRPVSAGEVEGGSPSADFPANSYFNVFVEVDVPGGGFFPALQLVNIDPLLVEHAGIGAFPPVVVYQHGNSQAVSMYLSQGITFPDPAGGPDITLPRGSLFGQLTLAGHGVGFGEGEIASFETEIENEMASSMPVNPIPVRVVDIQDFSPDYSAEAAALSSPRFTAEGGFAFTVSHARLGILNYIQSASKLSPGDWSTIWTNAPAAATFDFSDPSPGAGRKFYRWSETP